MNKLLSVILLTTLFTVSLLSAQKAKPAEPANVIIVLDASGSMWGKVHGRAKIDIAKEVIKDVTAKLSPDINLGLVVYGHRKKGDCSDIELLIPPTKLNRSAFNSKVQSITPKGMTPLTSAVEFAAEKLKYKETRSAVILITDGKETCDRDPCKIAGILEKNGLDFTAHVVAFDLTAKDAKSVECVAKLTGGLFLKADDTASLKDSLEMAIEDTKETERVEEKLDPATIKVPAKVVQGAMFKVEWEGPNNKGDYIAIIPKNAEDGTRYRNYFYTKKGSPSKLLALMEVGSAQVRYIAGRSGKILGRADIEITKAEVTLSGPDEIVAGGATKVAWTGPNNKNDYITIVYKDEEDGKYGQYTYTRKGSPLKVPAPMKPGTAEIRYMSGQGGKVLARRLIEITKAEVTLSGPDEIVAGGATKVAWTGPNNKNDYITIVYKDEEDGKYGKYTYTRKGSPLKVPAPMKPGTAEIRYMSGQGGKVLARRLIEITKAEVTLSGPDEIVAGGATKVAWTGPNNKNDYITIVYKDEEDGKYGKYTYTRKGSPLKVPAPMKPGTAEIRYMSGQGGKVLARRLIEIIEAKVELTALEEMVAGSEVKVDWVGPDNKGDYITIVAKDADDGKYAKYTYTMKGTPLKVTAPLEAGVAEIRYMSGQGGKVLARKSIKLTEPVITMSAPGTVISGEKVKIEWTGPNNKGDYISIVPKDTEDGKRAKYKYTRDGSPVKIEAPSKTGAAEIRYISGQGGKVLKRRAIEVTAAEEPSEE